VHSQARYRLCYHQPNQQKPHTPSLRLNPALRPVDNHQVHLLKNHQEPQLHCPVVNHLHNHRFILHSSRQWALRISPGRDQVVSLLLDRLLRAVSRLHSPRRRNPQ
jgi:hypothetical protein